VEIYLGCIDTEGQSHQRTALLGGDLRYVFSQAVAQLDAVLQEWRERPLGEITYLYVELA
jgi:hypothetical protein